MDFNRHHAQNHHGYNFNSRQHNSGTSSYGGYHQPGGFVNHPHQPQGHTHAARSFKFNSGHGLNTSRLNLMHSYRNLMKLQSEVVTERNQGFQKLRQLRDLMLSRITTIAGTLLKDEFLDGLITEVSQGIITDDEQIKVNNQQSVSTEDVENKVIDLKEPPDSKIILPKRCAGVLEDIKNIWRSNLQNAVKAIVEETEIYSMKEDNFLGAMFAKTKRVEQDFGEFFSEAERQITDFEKKSRGGEQYGQILSRLRTTERELTIRNEVRLQESLERKIMQLEDALKIVDDRSEKFLAELQQVNSDCKFEKLQLQHHAEATKLYANNAKYIALEVLVRTCQWKRCSCGRNYDEILREFEVNLNSAFTCDPKDFYPVETFQKMPDRQQMTWAWLLPQNISNVTPYHQQSLPIPVGGFAPTDGAAKNGPVLNDLRDRYDELQFKGVPNCEELRIMMLKITSHFKAGNYRVCEEMQGKQFVSSLFFCNTEDLVPNKTGKIFSTGYGDTPEEATQNSVQQAVNEIQRIENTVPGVPIPAAGEVPITYISRNPGTKSGSGKLEKEIRMTLLRSYCVENDDTDEETSEAVGVGCLQLLQEAHLYQNHANAAEEKYMVDWKIHLRVEDSVESGLTEKLRQVFLAIKDIHISNFLHNRPRKEIQI